LEVWISDEIEELWYEKDIINDGCYASRYLALNTGFCPTLDESFRKTKH